MNSSDVHNNIQYTVDKILKQGYKRIQSFEYEGRTYWIKCTEQPKGTMRIVKSNPQKAIEGEVEVLKHLNKRNAPVSKLVLSGPSYLVLEDVGKTVNYLIKDNHHDMQKVESYILKCSCALADLHNRDLYHGRPAIRDIAWDGMQIRFIDFELKSNSTNLNFNKERDLLIFIHDLYRSPLLNQDIIEEAITCYREHQGEEIFQKIVTRVYKWRMLYYTLRLFRPIAKKDLIAGLNLCEYLLKQNKVP